MEGQLRVQLLGRFYIEYDGTVLTTVATPRLQAFFAYLLLHAGIPQSRRHLAFLFWPDSTEGQARTNLRVRLHRLRQALPGADRFMMVDDNQVMWLENAPCTVDVLTYERSLAAAAAASEDEVLPLLTGAVNLYTGDLLPDCYDEWVAPRRQRLRDGYQQALERLIGLHEGRGNIGQAVEYARTLIRHDPLYEAAYRHLMRLYTNLEDNVRALHTYHACATVLQTELDIEPTARTRALYEALLHREETAVPTEAGRVPLVGRERLWRTLERSWRRVVGGGSPQLILLEGEPGIGKTELAELFLARVGRRGAGTAVARCYASSSNLPYAPLVALLRASPRPSLEESWLRELGRLLPEWASPASQPTAPNEPGQRLRLFQALAQAILARTQPLLLFLDDGQWADRETVEWLPYLLRLEPRPRLMVLMTARLEDAAADHPLHGLIHELAAGNQFSRHALERLSPAETAALATGIRGKPLSPDEANYLYQHSEGNPLFIVEMVRSGAELAPRDNRRLEVTTRAPDLPPRVEALIVARLESLSPEALRLAELAAVIGRSFTTDLLLEAAARAGMTDEASLLLRLDELWRRRIVREQGDNIYDFHHGKLREVTYGRLGAAQRRRLHGAVARGLEALFSANPTMVAAQLAAHFYAAGALRRAIHYAAHTITTGENLYANASVLENVARFLAWLGEESSRLTTPDEVAHNKRLRGQALLRRCQTYALLRDLPRLEADVRALQQLGGELGDNNLLANSYYRQAELELWRGRLTNAEQSARLGIDLCRAAGERLMEAKCHRLQGMVLREAGNSAGAAGALQRAIALFVQMNDAIGEIHALGNLATLHYREGAYQTAMELSRRALIRCEEAGLPFRRRLPLGDLGAAAVALGQLALARQALNESLALAREVGDRTQEIFCLGHLGRLSLQQNQPQEACRYFESGLALSGFASPAERKWLRDGLHAATQQL